MRATNDLYMWYFQGVSAMGGWIVFLALGVVAVIALIWDAQRRRIRATGWLLGAILMTSLVLPSMVYRFASLETRYSLEHFKEWFFYLGLLAGIIPPIVALGYFVTYAGMSGCDHGHVFETILGSCPICAEQRAAPAPGQAWSPPSGQSNAGAAPAAPRAVPQPSRPEVGYAWLVDKSSSRKYALSQGITRIGRGDENDVVLKDLAVSRRGHAQIREAGGRFTVSDIGGMTSVLLNGERLHTPIVMQSKDEITIGDTVLIFVTSR